jgi:hypothetical protein
MQTWQIQYFLFNNYFKFKNQTFRSFYLCGRFETRCFETRRFVNLMFCKPDVLKVDVLKSDVLKPFILKPGVLWVYPSGTSNILYFFLCLWLIFAPGSGFAFWKRIRILIFRGIFCGFLDVLYSTLFPLPPLCRKDAGIEPRTVATLTLAARGSNHGQ